MLHPIDQQGSHCCHYFLTITESYHNKVTPIGLLHADQIAEVVLLCVFRIAFPASHLERWNILGGCTPAPWVLSGDLLVPHPSAGDIPRPGLQAAGQPQPLAPVKSVVRGGDVVAVIARTAVEKVTDWYWNPLVERERWV